MTHNSSVLFWLKHNILSTKVAHQKANFQITVHIFALKFTKYLKSFLEMIVNFPSNFASFFSVMRHNSSVLFHLKSISSKTLYALDKISPPRCKFSDFWLLESKLTKLLVSFLKPQVSFSLNFASPFSVVTHNSSEIF